MKILIISDTHGRNDAIKNTIDRVSPVDLLIHLGDYGGGEKYIESMASCPVEMVSGNNDYGIGLVKEKIIHIGKYTVLLTHGHKYGVYYSTTGILDAGIKVQADIVIFGHTHIPMIDLSREVWLINPGSLAQPRQYGGIPTFIIMELDQNGDAHFTLNYYRSS